MTLYEISKKIIIRFEDLVKVAGSLSCRLPRPGCRIRVMSSSEKVTVMMVIIEFPAGLSEQSSSQRGTSSPVGPRASRCQSMQGRCVVRKKGSGHSEGRCEGQVY